MARKSEKRSEKRKARKERRKNRKARHQSTSKLNLESLDPRILMDASGAISEAFEVAQSADFNANQTPSVSLDTTESQSLSATSSSLRHELVFVDAGVEGQDKLIGDLQASRPGVLREVIHINGDSDGLLQIAEHLEGRKDIDAVHVVSHGEQAELRLGDAVITQDELQSESADALATIRGSFSDDGDLLIYGCNFGGGEAGEEAVSTLSQLTGADVAASNDLTGAADKLSLIHI